MTQLPAAIFVIDPKREKLAIHEARRLSIPVIAVTDTNCDPDDADYLIPANDDAIRAVRLLTAGIADAAIEGQTRHDIALADREDAGSAPRRDDLFEVFSVPEPEAGAAPLVDNAAGAAPGTSEQA